MTRAIAPRPQLLTYPDSLGGDLRTLGDLLEGPLDGVFHGVHILPPFPSSGDRGFAPLTHDVIDPSNPPIMPSLAVAVRSPSLKSGSTPNGLS